MASIEPELITRVGSFPVTNTVITTLLVDVVLLGFVFYVYSRLKKIPGKLQSAVELLIEYFYNITKQISGDRVRAIFPWVMSFFIFILVSNLVGLLPGVGSIGVLGHENGEEHLVPLLRPGTSDFNGTLALAVVSFFATHIFAVKYLGGRGYIGHFFRTDPWYLIIIFLFVGVLEIVSEFVKVASLSFRLVGNIYAGEVVLATISNLFAFVAPIPFLMLESIVAIVQALVFSFLTMAFMTAMTEKH